VLIEHEDAPHSAYHSHADHAWKYSPEDGTSSDDEDVMMPVLDPTNAAMSTWLTKRARRLRYKLVAR
jgi:hypothetical protein